MAKTKTTKKKPTKKGSQGKSLANGKVQMYSYIRPSLKQALVSKAKSATKRGRFTSYSMLVEKAVAYAVKHPRIFEARA